MFNRKIINNLKAWSEKKDHKPLVLRGARQVGKTTAVKIFSSNFDLFIPLNCELQADRALFEKNMSIKDVINALFFLKGVSPKKDQKVLIFIDEIQKSPQAVGLLRYFYEDTPDLYVIAAGSLLETMIDTHISFPVGRVEFMLMHPLSFEEFLIALNEFQAAELLTTVPVPSYAHEKLQSLYKEYILSGGMPEAVSAYIDNKDLIRIDKIHESLITAYLEDIEKYAPTNRMASIIRHVISCIWNEASGRIRYDGFGNSNYQSRDIKEAFTILQKAFILQVVHPVTSTSLPLQPDLKKSPRLHILDTGLVVYKTGMRKALFTSEDINTVFAGRLIEHITGQELFALSTSPLHTLNFWARDKSQSNAEVDFVLPVNSKCIPIEVKSGASGRLRSLHAFINNADHSIGVRLYNGQFNVENAVTIDGKKYTLINIPWYQASMVERYVEMVLNKNASAW
jgi:predicted AAA+ superfamily ATPase